MQGMALVLILLGAPSEGWQPTNDAELNRQRGRNLQAQSNSSNQNLQTQDTDAEFANDLRSMLDDDRNAQVDFEDFDDERLRNLDLNIEQLRDENAPVDDFDQNSDNNEFRYLDDRQDQFDEASVGFDEPSHDVGRRESSSSTSFWNDLEFLNDDSIVDQGFVQEWLIQLDQGPSKQPNPFRFDTKYQLAANDEMPLPQLEQFETPFDDGSELDARHSRPLPTGERDFAQNNDLPPFVDEEPYDSRHNDVRLVNRRRRNTDETGIDGVPLRDQYFRNHDETNAQHVDVTTPAVNAQTINPPQHAHDQSRTHTTQKPNADTTDEQTFPVTHAETQNNDNADSDDKSRNSMKNAINQTISNKSWPFWGAVFLLIGSACLNVWFYWNSREMYNRYQDTLADLNELESRQDTSMSLESERYPKAHRQVLHA